MPTAVAKEYRAFLMPILYTNVDMTSELLATMSLPITKGRSKPMDTIWPNRKISISTMVGVMQGSVTWAMRRQRPQPSTSAASYNSGFTAEMAAR